MTTGDKTGKSDKILERFGKNTGRNLFVPRVFDLSGEEEVLKFIAERSFAHFISTDQGKAYVTSGAIIFNRELGGDTCFSHEFVGHIARRNPQVNAILAGKEVVALVPGPDAYISPRWYVEDLGLPTWSYISVQLRGVFDAVTDLAETREILEQTIRHLERDADKPWTLEDAPGELVESLIRHIVAFRFKVEDMQGIRRLNQHRSPVDRCGIVEGLSGCGDPGAGQIAELMLADITNQSTDTNRS